ncbi:uncharacterized protein [Procambarus clarkii]|uniref:uncharacterized protein n=1 Tax=Procambarus clarkii TaxID=6728 RepID=UPI001E67326D|nr:uncharacterized protein LOC123765351 [Procambarus clarkii]
MKSLVILCVMAACASAQVVVPGAVAYRAPSYDSAIIQSHRLGGNFAYSTNEAHAYAVQTPVIGQQIVPVGVTYTQGTPIVKSSTGYITQQIPHYGYTFPQFAGFSSYPYPYTFGSHVIAAAAPAAPAPAAEAPAAEAAAVEAA